MQTSGDSLKVKLGLIAASVLVTLVILEIGCRICIGYCMSDEKRERYVLYTDVPLSEHQYIPHHYLNYYTNPGYTHGKTHHNSYGYRGREFPLEKPPCVFRIVAIGGSTTYTIKVDDDDKTFTQQLERILANDYGYRNVEVINAGVGGYTSWESLINLEFRVLDLQPDLIVVYHGVNDIHARLVLPGVYRGDNSGYRKQWENPPIPFWEHSALLRIISRELHFTKQVSLGSFVQSEQYRGAGSKQDVEISQEDQMKMLDANPPVFFKRNLVSMIGVARQHGAEIMLTTFAHSTQKDDRVTTPVYERGYVENNAVVQDVARENKVALFDFARSMPSDGKYWSDSVHVNEEGALLKASLFAGFIHDAGLIRQPETANGQSCAAK